MTMSTSARAARTFMMSLVVPLGLLLGQPAVAAPQFETPPSYNPAQLQGLRRVGTNYTVVNPVRSDGLLRVYVLDTPYGQFTVRSDAMVHMRIVELNALALMEKVSNSDTFTQALVQAGLNPIKYTGKLITNPIGTVQDTLSGVGAMFGRIAAGLANQGQTRDKPLASLLGVTDERRKIAAAYGVDPYTDFPPLDAKLNQLSRAAAAGGLVVTGALIAVPGAAGIVVSNLSTANKLNNVGLDELARSYTAAQIMNLNRGRLNAMGIDPALIKRLFANPYYTPIDMAALVAALDSMKNVEGREVYVAYAAAAHARYAAYLIRWQAEFMADANRRDHRFTRLISLAGTPFLFTRGGHIVTLTTIDALSWTPDTAGVFGDMTASRRRLAPTARGQIVITGQATALARRQLKAQGWSLLEHQRP